MISSHQCGEQEAGSCTIGTYDDRCGKFTHSAADFAIELPNNCESRFFHSGSLILHIERAPVYVFGNIIDLETFFNSQMGSLTTIFSSQ